MSWIATGTMATLSIASNVSKNKQAGENARAQALFLAQQASVTRNSIIEGGKDVQRQIAMEMTNQQKLQSIANSNATAMMSSNNVFGGVAAKILQEKEMQATLVTSNLQQAAEAGISDMFSKLESARINYQNGAMQNEMNRVNSQVSGLAMAAGAVSAGAGGYDLSYKIQNPSSVAKVNEGTTK